MMGQDNRPYRVASSLRWVLVGGAIVLALGMPPFGYLMTPYYQITHRRENICRVISGLDYFGAI